MTNPVPVEDGFIPAEQNELAARLMPRPPLGGNLNQIDAIRIAEIGAQMGGIGFEHSSVQALFSELQSASVEVFLQRLPKLLAKLDNLRRASIARLMQDVRALPEAIPPQTMWNRLMNPQVVSYVDRAAVLQLLAMAMERPTAHR